MSSLNDEYRDAYDWVTRSAAYMIYPPGWEPDLPPPYEPPPPTHIPGTDIPYITEEQHREMGHFLWPVTAAALDPEGRRVELIRSDVTYSLYSDIEKFFSNVWSFIWADEPGGSTWLSTINHYIWRISEEVITWLTAIRDAVVDQITGLANFVGNIYTWIVWNLVDDVINFVTNLFRPITDAWSSVTSTLELWFNYIYDAVIALFQDPIQWIKDIFADLYTWLGSIKDAIWDTVVDAYTTIALWLSSIKETIWDSIVDGYISITDWLSSIRDAVWNALVDTGVSGVSWLSGIRDVIWDSLAAAMDTLGGYIGTNLTAFAVTMEAYYKGIVDYWWDKIKEVFTFVMEDLIPAVGEATSGALGWLKDEFTNLIGLAYDEILGKAKEVVPITPERSALVAAGMFGSAVGFGALAHSMALAVEAVPNLKYMGVHYMSAFVARMGSFGTISSATMGVIAALAIREPFTYYMNSILRPAVPDEKLLIEFRSKREITFEQFQGYMKYHGYTDQWIEKIDSWLWKDPRLFEILYCADVTVPPTEWLQRKFERAGYEDIDIPTLIKTVERRTTQSPRIYYTTSLRRNFRHGFLTEAELVEGIGALEMATEAIDWIKRTGVLDNLYEVNQDWVMAFKTAYRNDIISEEEMIASLAAIGLPADRVEGIAELEWVRKQPKVLSAERKEIETEWREIQKKYSTVYIESFRRGLITEAALTAYLAAIGINGKVAAMSARHEAIKRIPKPKPEAIPIPVIPIAPEPPVYET